MNREMLVTAKREISRVRRWRNAWSASALGSNTKSVLNALDMRMDADGGSCFPSISDLAELSSLDKKTVRKHVAIAVAAGWIEVIGGTFGGQRWRRHSYRARWPDDFGNGKMVGDMSARKGEGNPGGKVGENSAEGGGIDAPKVGEQLPQDKNTPINTPRARANAQGVPVGSSVVAAYCGKLWMAHRLWLLMQPAQAVELTVVDRWKLERREASYDELMFSRRRDAGWPEVARMIADAQKRDRSGRRKEFRCSPALLPVAAGFVQAQRRSDIFDAWGRLHARRGWPFSGLLADWVYFPPLADPAGDLDNEVEAAMAVFEMQANELMSEGAGAEES